MSPMPIESLQLKALEQRSQLHRTASDLRAITYSRFLWLPERSASCRGTVLLNCFLIAERSPEKITPTPGDSARRRRQLASQERR
jgi:hypothetical protein